MTIQSAQVAVSTVAVSLANGGNNGVRVSVRNPSGPTAYLGGTGVGTASGYQLGSAETAFSTYLEQSEGLYAITGSGTATLHVLVGGSA